MPGILERIDIFDQSSLVREGGVVLELTRIAHVYGLSGTDALQEAIETPGVPRGWEAHPILYNLHCVSWTPTALSGDQATIACRYVNAVHRIYNGGGALEALQTNKELNTDGSRTKVFVLPAEGFSGIQPAVVTGLFPEFSLSVESIHPSILYDGIDPLLIAANNINKVNDAPFRHAAAREWLVERVGFSNAGLGDVAWRMLFEIRARQGGWDELATWTDPETGKPGVGGSPPDTSDRLVRLHNEVDFGVLESNNFL